MKNFRHYIMNSLPISVLLGLVLSLTQIAATSNAQTINRDEIRTIIRQLEQKEKDLIKAITTMQDLIPLLDSDKYFVIEVPGWGFFPLKREDVEEKALIAVLTGQTTPERVIAQLQAANQVKKQYQAELRKELPGLERQLAKTRADYSFYISELARLNEKASTNEKASKGCADLTGSWVNTIPTGRSTWEIRWSGNGNYEASEGGMGNAKSTSVTFSGNTLTINWIAGGIEGRYVWQLDENCQQSTNGILTWTRGLSGTHKSTFKRQ